MRKLKLLWLVLAVVVALLLWYWWPRGARVVLVGVDGGADYLLDEFLAEGKLAADGGFATLARAGVRAETSTPINISVTSPSFASLFTGAYPERHGLMGNFYYRVTDPIGQTSSGFTAPLQAESLWATACQAGKSVVLVGMEIALPEPPKCVRIFGQGKSAGPSGLVELNRADFVRAEEWQFGRRQFEQAFAARIVFPTRKQGEQWAYLLVVDGIADGKTVFEQVILDFDRDLSNGTAAELRVGEWGAVRLPVASELGSAIGAWVKLLELAPDLTRLRLYRGGAHYNVGQPRQFVLSVERALAQEPGLGSFWPGGPDSRALALGWLDEEMWLEQMARHGRYLSAATVYVLRRERFDLLAAYQPQCDDAGHQFLLRHPRQEGYADESLRGRWAEHVLRAWREVDANLKAIIEAAGKKTDVLVVADHGMSPEHTRVYPNRLLAAKGWRVQGEGTQVRAEPSGGQAHVYINLAGRQAGGVVAAGDYEKLVEQVLAAFTGLRDPETRQPVCEVVVRRAATREYRILNEQTTGDVWVSLKPGYNFSSEATPGPVFEPIRPPRGQHGYLARFREMETLFVAAGPHIRATQLGRINNVDVAPTLAKILGIAAPRAAQGRVLSEILSLKNAD